MHVYYVNLLCLIQSEMIRKGILNDFVFLSDVAIREVKLTMENDKKRALNELRRQSEHDKLKAIEEIKKKQWCARCGREAQFYW
jgi:predicted RecB family endonuclease